MALGINEAGIVQRTEDGQTVLVRPSANGGPETEIEAPVELAEAGRLATGDVAHGEIEQIVVEGSPISPEVLEDESLGDEQFDEPSAIRNRIIPEWIDARPILRERLVSIHTINGLPFHLAEDRPFPRTRRSHTERSTPDRRLRIATSDADQTGRILDFAAPLAAGSMGIIYGPHGSGLTYTLRCLMAGICLNAPDCVTIALLLRARSEEATYWRRAFVNSDIVVCPSASSGATPQQVLRIANLTLEAAQRQTELGRDVVLLVDSLTGLWGAMLEEEGADAQLQADRSIARQRLREWVHRAGCFHGVTPLGGSLGGSLTIIGAVWDQVYDIEEEEEKELHPHLRLMEHLLPESSWRVPLSGGLAVQRIFPAINIKDCFSQYEESVLPPELFRALAQARGNLPRGEPFECYERTTSALAESAGELEFTSKLIRDDSGVT
ncbi:MAG TPA: hypothetical protein VGS41_11575 [Chthonomonadales bacterium]|nr:hypothetical protein [Chthonomonadales bacterium]